MSTLDQKIIQTKEKYEQLNRQKKQADIRERRKRNKDDIRRKIIIGEIVLKYFPEVQKYNAQRSKSSTEKEFLLVETFVSLLAKDTEYVKNIKAIACKKVCSQTDGRNDNNKSCNP